MVGNHRFKRMASSLGIIEVPLCINLQPHRKLMKMLGHLMIIIKAFVEICFAIAIEIAQDYKLIPASHMNNIVHQLKPKGLK